MSRNCLLGDIRVNRFYSFRLSNAWAHARSLLDKALRCLRSTFTGMHRINISSDRQTDRKGMKNYTKIWTTRNKLDLISVNWVGDKSKFFDYAGFLIGVMRFADGVCIEEILVWICPSDVGSKITFTFNPWTACWSQIYASVLGAQIAVVSALLRRTPKLLSAGFLQPGIIQFM